MFRAFLLVMAAVLSASAFAEIVRCENASSFIEFRQVTGLGYVVIRAYAKDAGGNHSVLASNYVVGDFEQTANGYSTTPDNETFLKGVTENAGIRIHVSHGGILHDLRLATNESNLARFEPTRDCIWVDVEPKGLLSNYGASFKDMVSAKN